MRRRAALAVVPLLLFPAACGSADDKGDDKDSSSTASTSLEGVKVTGDFGAVPTVEAKDLKAPAEPQSAVLITGDGNKVEKGWMAHITIISGVDGKKLQSTVDTNSPVSASDVPIPALADALKGVPAGSRVVLETKAGETLSESGLEQFGLTADDALLLVVDVLSVPLTGPEGKEVTPPAGTPKVLTKDGDVTGIDWSGVGDKPKDLQVITLIQGEGPPIEAGQSVTFDYFGEVFKGDKPFDESYSADPVSFSVGTGSLIKAWDEGLVGIKQGSRVMIITPPDKGYGAEGSPPNIPGNSTLVFVLDVLGVG